MDVALGVGLEVDHEGVGMAHGARQVVVETGVVEEEAEAVVAAAHLRVEEGGGLAACWPWCG